MLDVLTKGNLHSRPLAVSGVANAGATLSYYLIVCLVSTIRSLNVTARPGGLM